jgi:hypothetical protein
MRRSPVACRRAVQSLQSPAAQHIWISDDLLTAALSQFFRSSCPQQKRHGSHVPGPLEARRRAAKRRMTASAGFYPQESFPQPFSLSAFFGFRKDSQPTWRYEAPSLQHDAEPLDQGVSLRLSTGHNGALLTAIASNPAPSNSKPRSDHAHPAERTTSAANAEALHSQPSFAPNFSYSEPSGVRDSVGRIVRDDVGVESGVVTRSQHLEQHHGATPDAVDIETYFEIFKSNVTDAEGFSGSERGEFLVDVWRSSRPAHAEVWRYNAMVVRHLTELGWDPTCILSELTFLAVPPTYSEESLDFLKCLEQSAARFPHASRVHRRVYMMLAEAAAVAEASKKPSQDLELSFLLRQTLQSAYSRSANFKQFVAKTLAAVAGKIQDPSFRKSLHSILAGINSAEQSLTLLLARAAKSHSLYATVEQVLYCLPRQRVQSLVPSITTSLVKAIEWKSRLSNDTYRDRLSAWLTVLEKLDSRPEFDGSYLATAVAEVAEHVFANCNPGQLRPHILLHALVFKLAQEMPSHAPYKERLLQLIYSVTDILPNDALSTQLPAALEQQGPTRLEATLGTILAQIQRASLPHAHLTKITIDHLIRHTNRFLTALDQEGLTLDDPSSLQDIVEEKMGLLRQRTAPSTEKQRQHYAFALRTCQMLLTFLSELATTTTVSIAAVQEELSTLQARRKFEAILDRAEENHALPLVYRNLSADISDKDRTILIHQLAHHYSLSTTRTHRETWRAIYYLYNYLVDNSLPIGPLFTKAVVRVSIIRPMIEHRFVSARRLIWVCQLVARVEGEAVAQKIESNYFQWRGDLILYAKGVHVEAGGDRKKKALVATMKRLGLI